MKTGILITARLGSTRLPKKHLLLVNGRPIITYLLDRIRIAFNSEMQSGQVELIIATADEPLNREFEQNVEIGAKVFFGSQTNIPLRHLQAADAHKLDAIIAVDGDDILCSTQGMKEIYSRLHNGIQYVKTCNLPFGMNVFGYSKEFLAAGLEKHRDATLETGWGRIFDATVLKEVAISNEPVDDKLRFTLDYPEDYDFFKTLICILGDSINTAKDESIIGIVRQHELYKMTEAISGQYWENFQRNMNDEKRSS